MCAPIAVNTASTTTVLQAIIVSQIVGLTVIGGVILTSLREKIASKIGKVSLVSVYLETLDESMAGPILVRLVEKVMGKRAEESGARLKAGGAEEVKT